MKIAIMQPYFFPYIGYWQLIYAVDQFVVYNDVNYIKGGWINRNRILCHGKPAFVNVLLKKASPNKKINEIEILDDTRYVAKLLRKLENCYNQAPQFQAVFPLISHVLLENREQRLDHYLLYIIRVICDYLGIGTPMFFSQDIFHNQHLHGETRVIDICEQLGADYYYNPIGGRDLYHSDNFIDHSIFLRFLKTDYISYSQFKNEFQPNLSIIDLMMFCSKQQIQNFLTMYTLLKE